MSVCKYFVDKTNKLVQQLDKQPRGRISNRSTSNTL